MRRRTNTNTFTGVYAMETKVFTHREVVALIRAMVYWITEEGHDRIGMSEQEARELLAKLEVIESNA
jgi:hypothetical protein